MEERRLGKLPKELQSSDTSESARSKSVELPADIERFDHVNVTFSLPTEQLLKMRRQAEREGIVLDKALQQTIDLGQITWDSLQKGDRVFLEDPEGRLSRGELLKRRKR
jgi:hypothetical protein